VVVAAAARTLIHEVKRKIIDADEAGMRNAVAASGAEVAEPSSTLVCEFLPVALPLLFLYQ
jgi:hypothetical protein